MQIINTFRSPSEPQTEEPHIGEGAYVRDSMVGKWTTIGAMVSMEECSMDDYSYIDHHSSLIYTDIGKFASIASMVRVNPGFHPVERPAMHHFTYRSKQYGFTDQDDEIFFNWRRLQRVTIGHDVWIGHGVVIMPGITIGNGAVVGSNSVVTKDIPPYGIAVGTPAKVIRFRFPRSISDAIERTGWWDWDHETIKERFNDFKDMRIFIDRYGKKS